MHVIVMAGGKGTRLGMGEKPLVSLLHKPLLEWVLDACREAEFPFLVATSKHTPYTANYCRSHGYTQFQTQGAGYVADLMEVLAELEVSGPVMTVVADLVGLFGSHLHAVQDAYLTASTEACSVWVFQRICLEYGFSYRCSEYHEGEMIVPAGVNVLDGSVFFREQTEMQYISDDPGFSCNVNCPSDLIAAENLLKKRIFRGQTNTTIK
jgi:adenosylcobinamide-phosphate guanylyltransferase